MGYSLILFSLILRLLLITLVVCNELLGPIRDWCTGANLFDVEVDDLALRLMDFCSRLVGAVALMNDGCIALLTQHR